jgi:hypothetical protein
MDVVDLKVPIVKVAGLVLFKGVLANPQMEGVLFGQGLDGLPVEKEFVPRENVDALLARINELEAAQAGAERPLMLLPDIAPVKPNKLNEAMPHEFDECGCPSHVDERGVTINPNQKCLCPGRMTGEHYNECTDGHPWRGSASAEAMP